VQSFKNTVLCRLIDVYTWGETMGHERELLMAVGQFTDAELLCGLERLVTADRALSAKLLVHLGEVDARRLYAERSYSSTYEYCTKALGMSESEAYLRIHAARVGRCYPVVLERHSVGDIHLTGIKLLAPLFREENHVQLLERARRMTKRQIEALVAELAPKPDVPASVRKLPDAPRSCEADAVGPQLALVSAAVAVSQAASSSIREPVFSGHVAGSAVAPLPARTRGSSTPLSPGRYKLVLTLSQQEHEKLEQLRELLRHQNPGGDLTVIVVRALSELHERTLKKRFAQSEAPKRPRTARPQPSASPAPSNAVHRISPDDAQHEQHTRDARHVERAEHEELVARELHAECVGPVWREPSKSVKGVVRSRYVPRAVVREVYARDGGQCTFVGADGGRCSARGFLEVHHHETTFARGGEAGVGNLRLVCRAHNRLYADRDYGRLFMVVRLRVAAAARSSAGDSRLMGWM
jgi:hypothetical protein